MKFIVIVDLNIQYINQKLKFLNLRYFDFYQQKYSFYIYTCYIECFSFPSPRRNEMEWKVFWFYTGKEGFHFFTLPHKIFISSKQVCPPPCVIVDQSCCCQFRNSSNIQRLPTKTATLMKTLIFHKKSF